MCAEKRDVEEKRFDRGIARLDLSDWRAFVDYVHDHIASQPDFIWRGQRDARWELTSGLDRAFSASSTDSRSDLARRLRFQHLQSFMLASRGRLDPRDLEERVLGLVTRDDDHPSDEVTLGPDYARSIENNWWAVGQHYGLVTPLLDWSTSPFVAAFFAFEEETPAREKVHRRAIYGLHKRLVSQKSDEIRESHSEPGRPDVIDFVEPLFKDNPRLTSQGGLFTRAPDGAPVQEWVQNAHDPVSEPDTVFLLAVTLPDQNREGILRALNRMNINHQSLFPDLYGATSFVNMRFKIGDY